MPQARTVGHVYAELGQLLFEQGRHKDAVDALTRARNEGASTPEVNLTLGRVYAALHKIDSAVDAFTLAVREDPSTLEIVQNELSLLLETPVSPAWRTTLTDLVRGLFVRATHHGKVLLKEITFRLADEGRSEAVEALRFLLLVNPEDVEAKERLAWLLLKERAEAEEGWRLFHELAERNPKNPAAFRGLGEASLALGRHDAAVDAFGRALELDPGNTGTLIGRGRAHRARGCLSEGLLDLEAAARAEPRDIAVLNELAEARKAAGDLPGAARAWTDAARARIERDELSGAEEVLRKAISTDPAAAETHLMLAELLLMRKRPDQARAVAEAAVALEDTPRARGVLAHVLYRQGARADALAEVERALAGGAGANALVLKGMILAEQDRSEEALAALDAAVDAEPSNEKAHATRAGILARAGRDPEAIQAYRRALQLAPDLWEAHADLGRILEQNGQNDEALEPLTRALEMRPAASLYVVKGRALARLRETEPALAALDEALRLDPANAEATRYRGFVLLESERYADAIPALQLAVDLDLVAGKEDPETHAMLAEALRLGGELRRAVLEFRKAISLQEDYTWALARYGETLRMLGQPDDAVKPLEQAVAIEPDNGWAWGALAAVHTDLDRYHSAVDACARALALDPHDWWAWCFRGIAFRLSGRLDAAVEAFDTAIEFAPDEPWVRVHKATALRLRPDGEHAALKLLDQTEVTPATAAQHFAESAICHYLVGDHAAVGDLVDLAVQHEPETKALQVLKGLALERLGHDEPARRAHEAALGTPQDASAYLERGKAYVEAREHRRALQDFLEAIRLAERPAEPYNTAKQLAAAYNAAAWTYAERLKENLDEAARLAAKAVELADEPELEGHFRDTLGRVWYWQHRVLDALSMLEKAALLNPESLEIKDHLTECRAAVAASAPVEQPVAEPA